MNAASKKEETKITSEIKVSSNSKSSTSKDNEFKISLSTEDIDKIEEEIRGIENDSKKSIGEFSSVEAEDELTDTEKNQNTSKKNDHMAPEYLENSWEDED
ncbi:MAG: hypothetical protein ACW9XH_04280 [Candidatus Nitrosopumilus sp. bin_32a]